MATDIRALIAKNQSRWDGMTLDPARAAGVHIRASVLCRPENKARFQAVEKGILAKGLRTTWWFVAICAEREAGGPPKCWSSQLAQGDPLGEVSRHDPAGRGPFLDHPDDTPANNAWVRGCYDALIDCAPHAAYWADWSPGSILTLWEEYNGLGYAARGVPSAYVWSGSNQYTSGKYVADHVYRASAVDVQEGCAPLIRCMMDLDESITFGVTPVPVTPRTPGPQLLPPPVPPVAPGASPSLWQMIVHGFESL